MKVWTKVKIIDENKDVKIISNSLTNYLYRNGPIIDIYNKYNISSSDRYILEKDWFYLKINAIEQQLKIKSK